jgi:hypothetical protein
MFAGYYLERHQQGGVLPPQFLINSIIIRSEDPEADRRYKINPYFTFLNPNLRFNRNENNRLAWQQMTDANMYSERWMTSTVVDLATAIYNEGHESNHSEMTPRLGDALMDAGCDNQELINHCLSHTTGTHKKSSLHYRSEGTEVYHYYEDCFVIDLILAGRGIMKGEYQWE